MAVVFLKAVLSPVCVVCVSAVAALHHRVIVGQRPPPPCRPIPRAMKIRSRRESKEEDQEERHQYAPAHTTHSNTDNQVSSFHTHTWLAALLVHNVWSLPFCVCVCCAALVFGPFPRLLLGPLPAVGWGATHPPQHAHTGRHTDSHTQGGVVSSGWLESCKPVMCVSAGPHPSSR